MFKIVGYINTTNGVDSSLLLDVYLHYFPGDVYDGPNGSVETLKTDKYILDSSIVIDLSHGTRPDEVRYNYMCWDFYENARMTEGIYVTKAINKFVNDASFGMCIASFICSMLYFAYWCCASPKLKLKPQ